MAEPTAPSIAYTVVGDPHVTTTPRTVMLEGQPVEAQVPALIVECISADGGMGHTFRFAGAAADAAAALFTPGATIVATFARENG